MRIEGTYTCPGTIERAFAALTNADQLARMLPGCERLIQLGPLLPDGAASFQVRAHATPAGSLVTMTATAVAARWPVHLRLELRGRTGSDPITGSGLIDLVAQEGYTLLAYVWDVDAGAIAPERQRAMRETARQYVREVCERLAGILLAEAEQAAGVTPITALRDDKTLEVTTPRGKIVKLPAASGRSPLSPVAAAWMQRAAWMTTGMLIGVSAIGLLMAFGRWLNDHEQ